MPRDPMIQRAFEVADDAMQCLFGYFMWVGAAHRVIEDADIHDVLPTQYPLTHGWTRNYDRREYVHEMRDLLPELHSRTCLVALVDLFSVAADTMRSRLVEQALEEAEQRRSYRSDLLWVFQKLSDPVYPDRQMAARAHDLCLHLDHARRLRNIYVHNNGRFDQAYFDSAIRWRHLEPLWHPRFPGIDRLDDASYANMSPEDYVTYSRSHIELLHLLHHEIQYLDYGIEETYNYGDQFRTIEWRRLLRGR